jgi:hypothetical protein
MYKIDNLPFYAYDVSLGDAVLAIADFDEKLATFKNILSKSGKRTIQILFELADLPELSGKILDALVKVGCGYEGANSRYFAVNVPALVDLSAISDLLSRAALQWEQSDPQRQRMRVCRVEEGRGCIEAFANGSVSLPRSSNRTCGFPASGFPTVFTQGSRRRQGAPALKA